MSTWQRVFTEEDFEEGSFVRDYGIQAFAETFQKAAQFQELVVSSFYSEGNLDIVFEVNSPGKVYAVRLELEKYDLDFGRSGLQQIQSV